MSDLKSILKALNGKNTNFAVDSTFLHLIKLYELHEHYIRNENININRTWKRKTNRKKILTKTILEQSYRIELIVGKDDWRIIKVS